MVYNGYHSVILPLTCLTLCHDYIDLLDVVKSSLFLLFYILELWARRTRFRILISKAPVD